MKSLITELKCDSCETGIVKLVVKGTKDNIEVSVKKCNNCKKSFGIKSVSKLEKVA